MSDDERLQQLHDDLEEIKALLHTVVGLLALLP